MGTKTNGNGAGNCTEENLCGEKKLETIKKI
jgi:hypothetical protein